MKSSFDHFVKSQPKDLQQQLNISISYEQYLSTHLKDGRSKTRK